MPSPRRRSSVNGPCEGKVIYRTEKEAAKVGRWLKRKGFIKHPYFCTYCKAFHLTSDKLKQRRRNG